MLPALPHIERLGADGAAALERVAVAVGVPPGELAAAMSIESNFRTTAQNPTSKATGLIQFLPNKETGLIFGQYTTAQVAAMGVLEQMALVGRFLRPYAGKMTRPGDVYVAIVQPARLGQEDEAVFAVAGERTYDQNAGLDENQDGKLQVGDLRARLLRELGHRPPATFTGAAPATRTRGAADIALIAAALFFVHHVGVSSRA